MRGVDDTRAGEEASARADGFGSRRARRVAFSHKFFNRIPGTYFRASEETGEPVMVVNLSGTEAALKFSGIRHELHLDDGDSDWSMLETVAQGLNYVSVLRIGDPVPSELISGEASWRVSASHRRLARQRITMQLVSWISGDEHVITDPDALLQVAEDPRTSETVTAAFAEAAERLGIGREHKQEVVGLVEAFADEIAYIETLRTQFARLGAIRTKIETLRGLYRNDRSVVGSIAPMLRLLRVALTGYQSIFDQVDAQTGEILGVLKNVGQQTRFVRETRDELHRRFAAWEGLVARWEAAPAGRSRDSERLLEDTYRFLARRFLPADEWVLVSKAQERAANAVEIRW